jgi:predicted ATP-grasp superfamily ATP-dependent carboligase
MTRAEEELSVLIPDGESHFTLPVVTCLGRTPGTKVHVLSSDRCARVRLSRYCGSFDVVPGDGGEEARQEAVIRAAGRHGVHVILPVCETGTCVLQRRRGEFEAVAALPPIPAEGGLEITSDKWRFAEFLAEHGIAHPPTLLCTMDRAFREALDSLGFPVLIKPRQGSGGVGIRAFEDAGALLGFLERHPETAGRFVVQSHIPGRDVDCSLLCRGGAILARTIQRPVLALSHGYAPATGIELLEHPEAAEVARRVVAALGWDGIAHIDLREDDRDGSVTVLEVNPRFWSSLLASHAAGVSFPRLACLSALGIVYPAPRQRPLRFLQARAAIEQAARALIRGRGASLPRLHETTWPYLLSDPMPHLLGRVGRGPRQTGGIRRQPRRAEAA